MDPGSSAWGVLVMAVVMVIAGYHIMTVLVRRQDVTANLNKVYSVLLMALVGALVGVLMLPRVSAPAVVGLALGAGLLVVAIREQYGIGGRGFLAAMIEHHGMAVVMARRVLEKGPRADVAALARGIIAAQEAEIRLMRGMLRPRGLALAR